MKARIRSATKLIINGMLKVVDLEIRRKERKRSVQDFLPLQETIDAAKRANLSVGDFVDMRHGLDGANATVEKMTELGVFDRPINRICEIGPGSGRYLEKVLKHCSPSHYEIYETAAEWAHWLEQNYRVVSQACDGKTLANTQSRSIDLVQAHKVFVCLPFFTIYRYLEEMARVVADNGVLVFDVFTEDCMDDVVVEKWFEAGVDFFNYLPSLMPKRYTIEVLERRSLWFVGSFMIPLWPGVTECMVFSKS